MNALQPDLKKLAPTYTEEKARDEVHGHGALLAVLPVQVEQGSRKDEEAYIADLQETQSVCCMILGRSHLTLCLSMSSCGEHTDLWRKALCGGNALGTGEGQRRFLRCEAGAGRMALM